MYLNIKRKYLYIWGIILLFMILFILFLIVKINETINGKKILTNGKINISSYYAEYEMTVISNKNTNTYTIKEWFNENIGNRFEYLDYMKNNIFVTTLKDSVYIVNDGNKANIITDKNNAKYNVLSLSTFFDIFNKDITCSCAKSIYDKEGEIHIIYNICDKENCNQDESIIHLGITELKLDIKDNVPITYTLYTGTKKEYACILYNRFETNILIEDNVFYINK